MKGAASKQAELERVLPALMRILDAAIREDIDETGTDITGVALPLRGKRAVGELRVKSAGVIAGIELLPLIPLLPVFSEQSLEVDDGELECFSGDVVRPPKSGYEVAGTLVGEARALLLLERSLLNLLSRMSGIATLTAKYVEAVKGTKARICDTRKTVPGLRIADKYAVACGGGHNHRFGLHDEAMIKENHLALSGLGVTDAVKAIRKKHPTKRLTCEAENLEQVADAVKAGVDCVLLDDFSLADMRRAIELRRKLKKNRIAFEASGGVNLKTVRAIAETGVERISIGALTHSVPALDMSFKIHRV